MYTYSKRPLFSSKFEINRNNKNIEMLDMKYMPNYRILGCLHLRLRYNRLDKMGKFGNCHNDWINFSTLISHGDYYADLDGLRW